MFIIHFDVMRRRVLFSVRHCDIVNFILFFKLFITPYGSKAHIHKKLYKYTRIKKKAKTSKVAHELLIVDLFV